MSTYPYLKFFEKYDGYQRKPPKDKWYVTHCPHPAHPDRNPSTFVDLSKPGWVCKSCGRTGNYIDFIMLKEGVSESAARLILSQYYVAHGQKGILGQTSKRVIKPEVNYLNPDESIDLFLPVSNNSVYSEYIKNRKLTIKLLNRYGFRQGSIIKKGWNDRLIYPIYDLDNNLCSIEGRDITNAAYLRYNKWPGSSVGYGLFGVDHLDSYNRSLPLFVVEGAFDALSIITTGYYSVALVCSDLTKEQLRQLKSKTDYPVMVFDGPKEGTELVRKEVYRKYRNVLSQNFKKYKIIEIPYKDTDPNDLLKLGKLKQFLKKSTN